MKKIIFFFVSVLLFGSIQKTYSQYECLGDIYVENECGNASLTAINFYNSSFRWENCNDTTCLSNQQTFYTNESGCYTLKVTGNSTGCYTELGYFLEISEPCDTITEDTTVCCTNCNVSVEIEYGCGEATITMTVDSFDNSCDYLYEWFTGEKTKSLKVYSSGYQKYRVISDNCDSGWKTVWVQIAPEPTVWISGKSQVCQGTTTTLIAMSSGSINSYKWNNGATTSTINAGAGTFKVSVTDMNGCEAFATKVVTEYPTPVVTISGKTEVCKDYKTELTASSSSCGSCFKWSTGETTKTIKVGKGTYTVTVTDPVTCCTATATITVTEIVVQIPDVYATIQDEKIIMGSFGSYKSLWSTGEIGQTITADSSGIYSVQGIDENGCLSDPSCPIPVFIKECEDDSVGTGGITLDTVICDTLIVYEDTLYLNNPVYIHDTVYVDGLEDCLHEGITNNWNIPWGTSFVPNSSQFFLFAPFGATNCKWNKGVEGTKEWVLAKTSSGTHNYKLECKVNGKNMYFCFLYTIKTGTTPTQELETRDEPIAWPNPTPGIFEIDLSNQPNGLYNIFNIYGQLVKKIIKQ